MHYLKLTLFVMLGALFIACESNPDAANTDATAEKNVKNITIATKPMPKGSEPNPGAEGFNRAGSDNRALEVADSIVKYHGGRGAWDNTAFLTWNFFGARTLHWDKINSRVRIDVPKDNAVFILDYSGEELAGRVRKLGNEVTDPEALATDLSAAYSMFINDAFWLVHQFKLKDSGVTLKYAGEARVDPQAQRPSYIIDQTFDGVGDTPQNRYRLFVDKVTYRINTWQFFREAGDTEPAIETPWSGYRPYGDIVLSNDRGGRFQLTNVAVKKRVDERLFNEF